MYIHVVSASLYLHVDAKRSSQLRRFQTGRNLIHPSTCSKNLKMGEVAHLSLRVELRAEVGLALMPYALVGTVVHVCKEGLPPLAQLAVVDGVAVVLGSDVALVCQSVHHRLR